LGRTWKIEPRAFGTLLSLRVWQIISTQDWRGLGASGAREPQRSDQLSVIAGRERAMTRKEAVDELREIQEINDLKVGHRLADDVLCRLLHSLGYRDVVAEYNKVGKWYDSQ
jgi:hypothetical protein